MNIRGFCGEEGLTSLQAGDHLFYDPETGFFSGRRPSATRDNRLYICGDDKWINYFLPTQQRLNEAQFIWLCRLIAELCGLKLVDYSCQRTIANWFDVEFVAR